MQNKGSRTPAQKLARRLSDEGRRYREHHRAEIRARRNTIPKECAYCGNDFLASTYDIAKGWGRFCSKQCSYASQRVDRESEQWKKERKRSQKAAGERYHQRHPDRVRAQERANNWKRFKRHRADITRERAERAKRTEKPCTKCGKVKPLSEFRKQHRAADGRDSACSRCAANRIKTWKIKNQDKVREQSNRRRAAKAGVPGSHTENEWRELCGRFEHRCVRCGSTSPLTRDHVVPLSKLGSSDFIDNVQPLCLPCNAGKCNRESIDYRNTPFVNSGQAILFV